MLLLVFKYHDYNLDIQHPVEMPPVRFTKACLNPFDFLVASTS